MKDNKPTHNLVLKPKSARSGSTIGVGWLDDRGFISIKLNAGVSLSWRDSDCSILLFPVDYGKARGEPAGTGPDQESELGEPAGMDRPEPPLWSPP